MKKLKEAKLAVAACFAVALVAGQVQAEAHALEVVTEEYTPTIWIDPDGCEHWVMDDGFEGYMTSHLDREGRPVCHRSEVCGIVATDTLFDTDEPWVAPSKKRELMAFFQEAEAFGFLIYGHTDSRASDEYNMRLSDQRANMVAQIARDAGGNVVDVRGFGERQPRAAGNSAHALQQNRRVEIYCIK